MNDAQWDNLVFKIEEKFGIKQRDKEEFVVNELPNGKKIVGQRQVIEFSGPLGLMKIVREIRPKVLEKKAIYSRRMGTGAVEKFVYSDQETVSDIKTYQQDSQGDWQEMKIDSSSF